MTEIQIQYDTVARMEPDYTVNLKYKFSVFRLGTECRIAVRAFPRSCSDWFLIVKKLGNVSNQKLQVNTLTAEITCSLR